MMWLFKLALSFLTPANLGDALNAVIGIINKKTDLKIEQVKVDGTVSVAQAQAAVPILQAQADIYKDRWGWWGTRWMSVAAAMPAIVHSGAIYLDSTFRFGWEIAKAPGVYEGLEIQIILGTVGILTVQSIFGRSK